MIYVAVILEKLLTNGLRAAAALWFLSLSGDSVSDTQARSLAVQWSATLGSWIYLFPVLTAQAFEFIPLPRRFLVGSCLSLLGGFMMVLGTDTRAFELASILLVLGTSFFRTDLPALLSHQLRLSGQNQQRAFTLFYAVMNVGTFLGVAAIAVWGESRGWRASQYAVLVGALGLAAVSLTFVRALGQFDEATPQFSTKHGILILGLFTAVATARHTGWWMNLLALFYGYWIISGKRWGFLVWTLVHGAFWIIYDQASTTLVIISDSAVDRVVRNLSGSPLPNTFFLLIDPVFNIVLGLILSHFTRRESQGSPRLARIMVAAVWIGVVFSAFLVQVKARVFYPVPMAEFIGVHLMFVFAEQLAVPTGLAFAAGAKDQRESTLRMGFWLFGISYFTWMSGKLGELVLSLSGMN